MLGVVRVGAGLPCTLGEIGTADVDPGSAFGVVTDNVFLRPNEDELEAVSELSKEAE